MKKIGYRNNAITFTKKNKTSHEIPHQTSTSSRPVSEKLPIPEQWLVFYQVVGAAQPRIDQIILVSQPLSAKLPKPQRLNKQLFTYFQKNCNLLAVSCQTQWGPP